MNKFNQIFEVIYERMWIIIGYIMLWIFLLLSLFFVGALILGLPLHWLGII